MVLVGQDTVQVSEPASRDPRASSPLPDPLPDGVPVYDDLMREQIERSQQTGTPSGNGSGSGDDALGSLLAGSDTWTVS